MSNSPYRQRARTDHWAVDDVFRLEQVIKRKGRRTLTYAIQRMAWGKLSDVLEVQPL